MTALEHLETISEMYECAFRRLPLPAVERCEIDLTAPDLVGSLWGRPESNIHRQRWRWLSALGYSNIFMRLDPLRDYRVRAHIHTAMPEALDALSVSGNGHSLAVGGMDWTDGRLFCWAILPNTALIEDNGFLRLTYAVDFGRLDGATVDRDKVIAFTGVSVEAT